MIYFIRHGESEANLRKVFAGQKDDSLLTDEGRVQAKCQQELNEYNTCLSEYNSKMAEYNSCLTESSNPDSWRYKSYCSKPSNYCFKPVCAY